MKPTVSSLAVLVSWKVNNDHRSQINHRTFHSLIGEMDEATFSCLFNREIDHIFGNLYVKKLCLIGAFEGRYCGSFNWEIWKKENIITISENTGSASLCNFKKNTKNFAITLLERYHFLDCANRKYNQKLFD